MCTRRAARICRRARSACSAFSTSPPPALRPPRARCLEQGDADRSGFAARRIQRGNQLPRAAAARGAAKPRPPAAVGPAGADRRHGRRFRQDDQACQTEDRGCSATAVQTPSSVPEEAWYNPAGWFSKDEYAVRPATRARSLTEPPAGTESPSPDQPYGISSTRRAGQSDVLQRSLIGTEDAGQFAGEPAARRRLTEPPPAIRRRRPDATVWRDRKHDRSRPGLDRCEPVRGSAPAKSDRAPSRLT